MNKTSIEWTDYTWNPIRARQLMRVILPGDPSPTRPRTGTFCTRISPGCKNCYASVINRRFGTGEEYEVPNLKHHEFFIDEKILEEPLRRKKPARIFVGDMFDLFHEAIPKELIDRVFNVALGCPQHTFQFLTKRAQRLHDYLSKDALDGGFCWDVDAAPACFLSPESCTWFWFGVSVEDKKRAEERIPLLQMTPAAVRFLSIEPQLEDIPTGFDTPELGWLSWLHPFEGADPPIPRIDWVICGGESGPGARPFNLAWAESLLKQCRTAGVPFFMKQCGSFPIMEREQWKSKHNPITKPRTHEIWLSAKNDPKLGATHQAVAIALKDRKGGDPSEWPEHLRVREFPSQKAEVVSA